MRVELLPAADPREPTPDPVVAVWSPRTDTAYINPAANVVEIVDAIAQATPDHDRGEIAEAVRAALRAHEVAGLEALLVEEAAPHPNEVTAEHPILFPVAASPGPRSAALIPCSADRLQPDDTQPVRAFDPGITADDIPPYPPPPDRRRSKLSLAPLVITSVAAVALVLAARAPSPPPAEPRPETSPTAPGGRAGGARDTSGSQVGGPGAGGSTTAPTTRASTSTSPSSSGPAGVYFANCSAAAAAGAAPIGLSDPGYRPALDRDSDGVACETAGETVPPGQPAPTDPPADPPPGTPAPDAPPSSSSPPAPIDPPVIDPPPIDPPPVDVPPVDELPIDPPPIDPPPVDLPPVDPGIPGGIGSP